MRASYIRIFSEHVDRRRQSRIPPPFAVDEGEGGHEAQVVGAGLGEQVPLHFRGTDDDPRSCVDVGLAVKLQFERRHAKRPRWAWLKLDRVFVLHDTAEPNRADDLAVLQDVEAGWQTSATPDPQHFSFGSIEQQEVGLAKQIEWMEGRRLGCVVPTSVGGLWVVEDPA